MKRLHVHVNVDDLASSIKFYSTLFGSKPSVEKQDYAKWLLDDPRVNFAISTRGRQPGLDHFGIQVESRDELAEISRRFTAADKALFEQTEATCCYAVSDKAWTADPQGLAWETFYSHADATVYGDDTIESTDVPRLAEGGTVSKAGSDTCCGP
ncbi:MAG: ArsI/CadI family heavy metal resistance metalloenzyme [Acidiferrobacterales bacterium]